jgi:6-phosphogluconolactonase (cycloisomerase 2 family)
MSKKTGVVVAFLGLCALSLFLASCGSSSSRPSGLLYVLSQAESNVSSYAIDLSSGNLSLITSNMPSTGGLPLSISLDPTGATAFVLNQGSIGGYNVHSDGSLSGPTGGIPLSQTALAMTRDVAGKFIFVISPGALPSPGDCSVPPVTDPSCPSITVFSTTPGSIAATLAGTFLLDRVPTALAVLTFTPLAGQTQTLLFVTSNVDLTALHNDNELSVYAVDSSGNLTEQASSPYTTEVNPRSVIAVDTNPVGLNTGGVFVYVGNQGAVTGSVSTFELCTQVNQVCSQTEVNAEQLASTGPPASIGINPTAMIADSTNSFLYIACTGSNSVFAFHMTTGTGQLQSLTPASRSTGGSPVALAMHPNYNAGAEFLYVSNNTGSSVTGFSVAVTTGALGTPNTVTFPPGSPSGIAGR